MDQELVQLFNRNLDQKITVELANGMIQSILKAHKQALAEEMLKCSPAYEEMTSVA